MSSLPNTTAQTTGYQHLRTVVLILAALQTMTALLLSHDPFNLAFLCCADGLMLLLAFRMTLRTSCLLIPLGWVMAQLTPTFNGAPYVVTVCGCIALLFVNASLRYAYTSLAVTCAGIIAVCCVLGAFDSAARTDLLATGATLALELLVATIIGLAIRHSYERTALQRMRTNLELERERSAQLRRDTALATRLHDSLTGNLSAVMMLAINEQEQAQDEDRRASWQQVADRMDESLGIAHEVIDILSGARAKAGDDDSGADGSVAADVDGDATATAGDDRADRPMTASELCRRLDALLSRRRAELDALGIHGQISVTGAATPADSGAEISADAAREALGLVGELYTNIRRHCAAGEDYACEVSIAGGAITVTQMNTQNRSTGHTTIAPSGRGLRLHRATIERLGGTLHAGPEPDGTWLLRAVIPV